MLNAKKRLCHCSFNTVSIGLSLELVLESLQKRETFFTEINVDVQTSEEYILELEGKTLLQITMTYFESKTASIPDFIDNTG